MALTVTQKTLIITIALVTIGGVGFYISQNLSTLQKVSKGKRSHKKSGKTDESVSNLKKDETDSKTRDSPKPKQSSPDSAKKLTESAAAVARGEVKLTQKEKEHLAVQLKEEGNHLFNNSQYNEAAQLYTEAIQLHPGNAIYYCNRAACYAYMQDYQSVINDCSKALEYDKTYVKALHRRANAFEQVGKLREALHDYSVMSVLENFKKESTVLETDRLIKLLVEKAASVVTSNDLSTFPSQFFIDAYENSFLPMNYPKSKESPEPDSMEAYFKEGLNLMEKNKYPEAFARVEKGIRECEEADHFASYLYNLYATLLFLQGRMDSASEALEKSLEFDSSNVNTVAKLCNLHLERGETDVSLNAFDMAIRKFPRSADLYYHRGQLKFLINDYGSSAQDFQKSLELEPDHCFAHIQFAVAQYKKGAIDPALALFEQCLQRFPTSPDVYCYYGEFLMEQRQFHEAMNNFNKAIALGSTMAYIDKAMLLHRVFQRSEEAIELLYEILKIDPKFDMAHIQLGIILLNQRREEEGSLHFDMAIQHARNQFEVVSALSTKEHALAQHFVQEFLPHGALL